MSLIIKHCSALFYTNCFKSSFQTQQLSERLEQRTEAETLVISIPFPTVTGQVARDKGKQQQRQNTSEITNRFQSLAGTRYNQVPFTSDELLQSHVAGRRTDPSYWKKLQDKIFSLRDNLQSIDRVQTVENLLQLKQSAFQIKTEIKAATLLNITHQANMIRKINILIRRILYMLNVIQSDVPTNPTPIILEKGQNTLQVF